MHGIIVPLLYPWYVIFIPMYNMHTYFSLKIWAKSVHYTWQNMVVLKEPIREAM